MTQRAVDMKKNNIIFSVVNEDEPPSFQFSIFLDKTTNRWCIKDFKTCEVLNLTKYLSLVDNFAKSWINDRTHAFDERQRKRTLDD